MKILLSCLILIFFTFFQFSFLPHFGFLLYLNLPLCYLIIYRFFNKKFFLFLAPFAGLLLDIFSIFPKGFYTSIFFLEALLIDWWLNQFSYYSIFVNFIVATLSTCFFQILVLISIQILSWLKIVQWQIILDAEYFNQFAFFIILNTLTIFLISQICLIILKRTS
jgi:hypothetical protein